jgi:hypothetical protein
MRDAGSWPTAGSRSVLSRVTRAVTLTTESLGIVARLVLDVMMAASVVLSLLAL